MHMSICKTYYPGRLEFTVVICAMKLALMSLAVQLKQIFFHCNDNNVRLYCFGFSGKELQSGRALIFG